MTLLISLGLTLVSHIFAYMAALYLFSAVVEPLRIVVIAWISTSAFLMWIAYNIMPVRIGENLQLRVKVMMGGRMLIHTSLISLLLNNLLYWAFAAGSFWPSLPVWVRVADGVVAALAVLFPMFNGGLRVLCLSRRLRILRRVLVLCACWFPLFGAIAFLYLARIAHDEYQYALYKKGLYERRAKTALCKTRYPIVMLHGAALREAKFFRYWGRIPRELERNGADVYYGDQQAWGTVENNAREVKRMVEEVMERTGCEKVNIVAYSKGGLDARYMISSLGMGDKVASLTTIASPHRGCEIVDLAQHMPSSVYAFFGKLANKYTVLFGDARPEFDVASRQFATEYVKRFNYENPDVAGVYYQSYAALMRFFFSDGLMMIPYIIVYFLRGPNDGLVDVESAQWGDFQGIISTEGWRGVSHSDLIDFKREDYYGFDVAEAYVGIVSSLRERGF